MNLLGLKKWRSLFFIVVYTFITAVLIYFVFTSVPLTKYLDVFNDPSLLDPAIIRFEAVFAGILISAIPVISIAAISVGYLLLLRIFQIFTKVKIGFGEIVRAVSIGYMVIFVEQILTYIFEIFTKQIIRSSIGSLAFWLGIPSRGVYSVSIFAIAFISFIAFSFRKKFQNCRYATFLLFVIPLSLYIFLAIL